MAVPRTHGPARFHFISGMPRSGSTLLAAILRQNPRLRSGMSTPLCSLFAAAKLAIGGEGHGLVDDNLRRRVLGGLFDSWAGDLPAGSAIVDTNRGWTAQLAALKAVRPDARLICTVRDVAEVMESIERLLRKNAFLPSRMFNDLERANVYTRTEALSQRDRLVGGAWSSLKEAFYGPYAESLLVVDYSYLARAPAKVIELVYRFLDEEPFEHDFQNVVFAEPEFDEELRMPGLHEIRRTVSYEPTPVTLPPDLRARFGRQNFWTDPRDSKAYLITPGKKA